MFKNNMKDPILPKDKTFTPKIICYFILFPHLPDLPSRNMPVLWIFRISSWT